jgi:NAD(P)-dependent dehydrogenase (short-subunit alcohol dehydrogenase family)
MRAHDMALHTERTPSTPPTAGPIALVTGATRGIGKEVVRGLAARGATVLLGARDLAQGAEIARELAGEHGAVEAIRLDVTQEDSIAAAARAVAARHGRLDVLVNNAGVLHELDFPAPSAVDVGRVRATYEVNTFGPIAVIHAMLPLLRTAPAARIVNVTSSHASLTRAGRLDGPGLTLLAYNSSKAALNAATLQYARELRDTPIKVNLADPMHCATDINGRTGTRSAAEGAAIVIELALLDDDGPTGAFVNADGPIPW